jgi:7-cyano-7-deazaguanine synthase
MACSISGCILLKKQRSSNDLKSIEKKLRSIIIRGEDRGRDSYGIISFSSNNTIIKIKDYVCPSKSSKINLEFITPKTTVVINTNRAEPTTEYVSHKKYSDIPPFGNNIFVAHNGTIANDQDIEDKYHLERNCKIDTAILSPLLEKQWDGSFRNLQKILRDTLVGSFALAVVDKRNPEILYLACNYKPLFLEYNTKFNVLFFSSLETYLHKQRTLWRSNPIRQMKPYSLMKLSTRRISKEVSLWKTNNRISRKGKALVICSGGLDSTVVAKIMVDRGLDVSLLHFRYRHKAERKEAQSVKQIADKLECSLIVVDTNIFRDIIGHSRLTTTSKNVMKEYDGKTGAEFAYEWVPARNLIFISIAVGIAEAQGFNIVALGNNLEEAGAYPDNEMIFINKLRDVLPYATNFQKKVDLEMPVGNLMKHEIVKLGVKINAPLEYSWSCYEGSDIHCGSCGPCYMRKKGFQINGWDDPVNYNA